MRFPQKPLQQQLKRSRKVGRRTKRREREGLERASSLEHHSCEWGQQIQPSSRPLTNRPQPNEVLEHCLCLTLSLRLSPFSSALCLYFFIRCMTSPTAHSTVYDTSLHLSASVPLFPHLSVSHSCSLLALKDFVMQTIVVWVHFSLFFCSTRQSDTGKIMRNYNRAMWNIE